MEEFHDAGGFPVVLRTLIEAGLIDGTAPTVASGTLAETCASARNFCPDVIRTFGDPVQPQGGIAVLRGNLAPDGAVLKPSAATPSLLRHRGRAVVFESIEHYHARIGDPALDVEATSILVLKGCGPRGYPGMPECGNMGLPPKLLRQGVTDMVRISDARMSGTAYGTVVLHVAPESALGGPLALVQDGDEIELDVPSRRLELLVDAAELDGRRVAWRPPAPASPSGYVRLFHDHVMQADRGCDFDFLLGERTSLVHRGAY
jgi:L-arabonate dehydrase